MANMSSATWDEPDHTYSAYIQATHGDFDLNPEHPPLMRYIGALGLLNMQLKMPPMEDRQYRLQEAIGGRDFLFRDDANTILFRVRMATPVITILLGLIVFFAAREIFGVGAGLIALGLRPLVRIDSAQRPHDYWHSKLWTCYMFHRLT
jgi:hypothetical protein